MRVKAILVFSKVIDNSNARHLIEDELIEFLL